MDKIAELGRIFSWYKTYPQDLYVFDSPLRNFQRMFPENHYGQDIEKFLSYQNYKSTQRGADLPWWGKYFFKNCSGFRIFIIAQNSRYKDVGSVVLAAYFLPINIDLDEFNRFACKMDSEHFKYAKYMQVKNQITEWTIDIDYLYLTDAAKVYKEGSWSENDFDIRKSRKLLEEEIRICNPDLIILLGKEPLKIWGREKEYGVTFQDKRTIFIEDRESIVAPFFVGQGRTQKNFSQKIEIATNLIKEKLKNNQI